MGNEDHITAACADALMGGSWSEIGLALALGLGTSLASARLDRAAHHARHPRELIRRDDGAHRDVVGERVAGDDARHGVRDAGDEVVVHARAREDPARRGAVLTGVVIGHLDEARDGRLDVRVVEMTCY